jgi:hypothetical protein
MVRGGNRFLSRSTGEDDERPFIATDWRAVEKNTLAGVFDLKLPSGLILHERSLHEQNGKRWCGLPGRPQLDADGRHRVDPHHTGKRLYSPSVSIAGKEAREAFQRQAIAAVDKLLGGAQ